MRGLEAGPSRPESAEAAGTSLTSPEVQLSLMLASYWEKHKQESDLPAITASAPETVSEDIFAAAADEWVDETKDLSLSERFRHVSDEHPGTSIDLKNEEAVAELLAQVRAWTPKTLH